MTLQFILKYSNTTNKDDNTEDTTDNTPSHKHKRCIFDIFSYSIRFSVFISSAIGLRRLSLMDNNGGIIPNFTSGCVF